MAFKPFLQLVRLPNLFTAAADPLAGWVVATGGFVAPERWGWLVAASVLIYAGGIVLNDVFDINIDRAERPNRPLPSGRVPFGLAAVLGALALVFGPVAAWQSGLPMAPRVAAILALTVLVYDGPGKRTPLGPVLMGACRALNLLLGFTATPNLTVPTLDGWLSWSLAAAFGLFVVGVTIISRSEVAARSKRGIVLGLVVELVALLTLGAIASRIHLALNRTQTTPLLGVVLFLLLFQILARVGRRAVAEPTPALVQRAVKTGVLSLVWLDVATVATARDLGPALVIAALWVPAFVIGRWLYTT